MNRRDFLLSTGGFALAPTIVRGQANSAPASSETIFADFEGGNYEGWMLTGNCWTPEPYSDKHFPGKITGFQGKRFLCSYHPTLGNNATGKATSKEFTIEKPFINFLIGGGNHPGEACLNLVVNGKVERSATGRNSAELVPASWDVSLLNGKKAQFVVEDVSMSAERGYIMVDEITMSSLPRDKHLLYYESGPTLAQYGIDPMYFRNSMTKFAQPYGNLEFGPLFDFGVTPNTHIQLINAVCSGAYRLDHNPNRSFAQTAKLLTANVNEELASRSIAPSRFLQEWLYAEAICAFVSSHIRACTPEEMKADSEAVFQRQENPEQVYRLGGAVCSGYAKVTAEIARAANLICSPINGLARIGGKPAPAKADGDNHTWVMFEFVGGIRVPADTSNTSPGSAKAFRKIGWRALPHTPRCWELFMGLYSPTMVRPPINASNPKRDVRLATIERDDWYAMRPEAYWKLERWYDNDVLEVHLDPAELNQNLAYNPGNNKYPRASASYTSPYDNVAHINDGKISFGEMPHNRWTAFGSANSSDWVQLDFKAPHRISSVVLYFYDDTGRGGVRLPVRYGIQIFAEGRWNTVENARLSPPRPVAEVANIVTFPTQIATSLRIVMVHSQDGKSGLTEVVVKGENK